VGVAYNIFVLLMWAALGSVGLVVMAIVLAPLLGYIAFRRDLAKLGGTACLECGKPIGREAVVDARDRAVAEAKKDAPEGPVKPMIRTTWRIGCPCCGHRMVHVPGECWLESET
jgi:hypothetical protein